MLLLILIAFQNSVRKGGGTATQKSPIRTGINTYCFDDDEKVFAAIKAGAAGYILKTAEPKNLLHAISEVYNGGVPMTPGIARKVFPVVEAQ